MGMRGALTSLGGSPLKAALRPLRLAPSGSRLRIVAARGKKSADNGGRQPEAVVPAAVTFCVHRHVEFGDNLCVVGSSPELGNWDPEGGVLMEWTEGDNWSARVDLPTPQDVEYKYIVRHGDCGEVEWQPGDNNVVAVLQQLRGKEPSLTISDEWPTLLPEEEEATESAGGDAEEVTAEDRGMEAAEGEKDAGAKTALGVEMSEQLASDKDDEPGDDEGTAVESGMAASKLVGLGESSDNSVKAVS